MDRQTGRLPARVRPLAEAKVRVGIIGTSWWVDLMYVPSLLSHEAVEVVAVCGRNLQRAQEVASKFGAPRIFQDYRQLIKESRCDAVVIATPDDLHCEMTIAAIEAGLHVLCEKPLAGNASDAMLMHDRATAAGVQHMVLFTWRGQPHWRYAKHLIESGFIGRCRHAQFRFLGSFALDPGYKWRFDGRRANGVTGDLGSHMIDFARWYLGEVGAVRADMRTFVDQTTDAATVEPVNDVGFVSLEFIGGARAEITASAVSLLGDEGVRVSAAFYGDDGTLEIDHPYFGANGGAKIRGLKKDEECFADMSVPASFLPDGVGGGQVLDPYVKQSAGPRQFIDAILGNATIETDFWVGVQAQRVVDAAIISSREDRWVRLDA